MSLKNSNVGKWAITMPNLQAERQNGADGPRGFSRPGRLIRRAGEVVISERPVLSQRPSTPRRSPARFNGLSSIKPQLGVQTSFRRRPDGRETSRRRFVPRFGEGRLTLCPASYLNLFLLSYIIGSGRNSLRIIEKLCPEKHY